MYKLMPTQDDNKLFFRLDGEAAERHGAIGYLRADFGTNGREFWTTWFDSQPHLKNARFKSEFDAVINALRDDGKEPPFASRRNLEAFCLAVPGKELTARGHGYMLRTQDYSYYIRCKPSPADYDVYLFAFDNRYLLPELEGKHSLPMSCYSVLPTSGELVILDLGESGYTISSGSRPECDVNRSRADYKNWSLGVTPAQEEAMLGGTMFGWDTPAAKPWNYEKDGSPRQQAQPPKRAEPER